MSSNELDQILVRCSLPVRDVALSPDGNWAAVASEYVLRPLPVPMLQFDADTFTSETVVKVVNTNDNVQIMYLRDQSRSVKHVTFHPTGTYLAASGTDGIIYVYSISSQQPSLIKKVEDVIQALEPDDDATSKAAWHPDGRAFAAVTPTKGMYQQLLYMQCTADVCRYCCHLTEHLGTPENLLHWAHGPYKRYSLVTKRGLPG